MLIRLLPAFVMMAVGITACTAQSPPDMDQSASAPLVFEPDHVDMGTVLEGKEAEALLRLRNTGDTPVHITRIETSCGCTMAEPAQYVLAPGALTQITVRVDTFAKQAEVKKWVRVTDQRGRVSTAWLNLNVQSDPHLNGSKHSLFDGACAACHAAPAAGKWTGEAIYAAVCAMCHGPAAAGAYAPALTGRKNGDALEAVIRHGTGTRHMPGFAREQGGPLTDAQIHALRQWLLSLDGDASGGYKSAP